MPHIYTHRPRVCLLKGGHTALTLVGELSESPENSPAVVEALVKGKANLEAASEVRHLEDSRCASYFLIDHACVS